MPIHIAGFLITMGGVSNVAAGFVKTRTEVNKSEKTIVQLNPQQPTITITSCSTLDGAETRETCLTQSVKTIS